MNLPLVLGAFAAGQVLVVAAAILLAELYVDERKAQLGAWVASVALAVGLLFALIFGLESARAGALVLALGLLGLARGADLLLVWLADLIAGLGDDWPGIDLGFLAGAAAVVLSVWVPMGLGHSLAAPDLFDSLALPYAAVAVLHLGVLVVRHWPTLDPDLARHGTSALSVLLIGGFLLTASLLGTVEVGRREIAAAMTAGVLAMQSITGLYLAMELGADEFDAERAGDVGRTLLVSLGLILVVWLAPILVG